MKMRIFIYYLVYLGLFLIAFYLLKFSHVSDINKSASIIESISSYLVTIIVLVAVTQWGMKAYRYLTN